MLQLVNSCYSTCTCILFKVILHCRIEFLASLSVDVYEHTAYSFDYLMFIIKHIGGRQYVQQFRHILFLG